MIYIVLLYGPSYVAGVIMVRKGVKTPMHTRESLCQGQMSSNMLPSVLPPL